MPRYLVKRDTWISHQGKLAKAGETVDIDWPGDKAPKLGDNLAPVEPEKPAKVEKSAKAEGKVEKSAKAEGKVEKVDGKSEGDQSLA